MSNPHQSPIVPIQANIINLFHGYKPTKNGKIFTGFFVLQRMLV